MDLMSMAATGTGKYSAPADYYFQDPQFTGPTPLQVDDDGHVRGHAALWSTCHTAFADVCVSPPREGSHDYYRLGEVVTKSGARVSVGAITMGTGHAPIQGVDPRRAVEHYDHTGHAVAYVASGEDRFGIWVAGVVSPQATPQQVAALRGSKLSGDWRRLGGKLRLVAMLAVNVPGFPVPRMRAGVTAGAQLALVASGIVPSQAAFDRRREQLALTTLRDKVRTRVHGDPAVLVASARADLIKRVKGT